MKEKILELLGSNHTTPCVFNDESLATQAIYTYRKDVFCLQWGSDFPFDDLTKEEQTEIANAIENKEYIKNKSFQ